MLFSVVIPTYNRADLLREALDSVLAQEFKEFEVIVVDDGSTDDTESVVRSYGKRIQFLQQQNSGPGAARNLGIKQARGKFVTFLDSDDLWFPWTLKCHYDVITDNPEASFIAGRSVRFSNLSDLNAVRRESSIDVCLYSDYLATSSESTWILPGSVAIKRDLLLKVGGLAPQRMNAEDSDLWLKLGTAPAFALIESPPIFAYRSNPGSAIAYLPHSYLGTKHLIEKEKDGFYPGGSERRSDRLRIIGRHVRPVAISLARKGLYNEACDLYWQSSRWHLELRRWRFLIGFWGVMLARKFRPS